MKSRRRAICLAPFLVFFLFGTMARAVDRMEVAALRQQLGERLGSGELEIERNAAGQVVSMSYTSVNLRVPSQSASNPAPFPRSSGTQADLASSSVFGPTATCPSEMVSVSCSGPRWGGSVANSKDANIVQSFTATAPQITAADFQFTALGDVPLQDRKQILVTLHEDGPDGPVLSRAGWKVYGPPDHGHFASWVRFHFPMAVPLTPGEKYYLRLDATDGGTPLLTGADWWIVTSNADGCDEFGGDYPDGEACGYNTVTGTCSPRNTDIPFRVLSCADPQGGLLAEVADLKAQVEALQTHTVMQALHACDCPPSVYLPAASGGRYETVETLVDGMLTEVANLGDPDVASNLASAQQCRDLADEAEGAGRYNLACKALATTLQLLSEPPNTGKGSSTWNSHATDRLCLRSCDEL